MMKSQTPHWWWFGRHQDTKRSLWLQSTLSELDQRIHAILKLIEEDADSFAKRAEMFYKRRPQLINMIEEFYRTHRSLIERYNQLRTMTDAATRQHLLTNMSSSFSLLTTIQPQSKFVNGMGMKYHAFCETNCDIDHQLEDSAESEVDDPIQKDEVLDDNGIEDIDLETRHDVEFELEDSTESEVDDPKQAGEVLDDDGIKEGVSSIINDVEARKLREEIERLREDNRIQKDELMHKDEEKKEVIRQLSLAISLLMEDNARLRKGGNGIKFANKGNPFDSGRFKGTFLRKLFQWPNSFPKTNVAL